MQYGNIFGWQGTLDPVPNFEFVSQSDYTDDEDVQEEVDVREVEFHRCLDGDLFMQNKLE